MICVYQLLNAEGTVLYVGTTSNFKARLSHHHSTRAWAPEIASHVIEEFETVEEAALRELELQTTLLPSHNVVHGGKLAGPNQNGKRQSFVEQGLLPRRRTERMTPPRTSKLTAPSAAPTVSIRVGEDTYAAILKIAEEEGCWIRSVVDRAVSEYVARRKK